MADISLGTAGLITTGIDHIVLHVRDPEVSKAFYIDVLGMAVDHEYGGHVFLKCGSQLLGLFQARQGDGFESGHDVNHLALNVGAGSYEDIRAHLEAAGITVGGRPGDDRCIYFNDPDGHMVQIVVPDQERLFVVPDQGRLFVVPDQGRLFVVPDQGRLFVVPDQGRLFVVPEQGRLFVVPDGGA